MSSSTAPRTITRRTALAGLGAGGLGVALAATRSASAQDATAAPTAGHPLVGTWIIDRDLRGTTEVPTVVVFTANGGFVDPGQGVAGVWEPTGPRSAAMTIIQFVDGGAGGYVAVRATWDIAEGDDTMTSAANVTVLTPDGTAVAGDELSSTATRMRVEPMASAGQALAGLPVWTPAPPAEATPTP